MYTRDEPLLRIEGVSKFYGPKKVLDNITVTIRDLHCSDQGRIVGQVVAFLGPSGCGKSTLFRIIAGLEPPTSGAVYLDDSKTPVKAGEIGVLLQAYPMSRNRTVLGNLMLAGRVGGLSDAAASSAAAGYLEKFDLADSADKYPIELSGGMRQRVAIARQLINMDGLPAGTPQLLLMDEPFSALDITNTRKVCRLIRGVADSNDRRSVVVVTHDLRAALSVADIIWVMGRTRNADGTLSGGRILREMDLVDKELVWNEHVYETKEFSELETELAGIFATL